MSRGFWKVFVELPRAQRLPGLQQMHQDLGSRPLGHPLCTPELPSLRGRRQLGDAPPRSLAGSGPQLPGCGRPRVASTGAAGRSASQLPSSSLARRSGCARASHSGLLPFPGTSQWPRAGAPGALSPSYDGGLHSLVSFLRGWGGCAGRGSSAVSCGHVSRAWPGAPSWSCRVL